MSLSDYVGEHTVSIRFVGDSQWGSSNPHIDDVTVSEPPAGAVAQLDYNSWNAGTTAVGQTKSTGNVFTLSNGGGGDLTVSAAAMSGSTDFTTSFDADSANAHLASGDYSFGFSYAPSDDGNDVSAFTISSNGGDDLTVDLTGSGYSLPADIVEIKRDPSYSGILMPMYGYYGYSYSQSLFLQKRTGAASWEPRATLTGLNMSASLPWQDGNGTPMNWMVLWSLGPWNARRKRPWQRCKPQGFLLEWSRRGPT